MKRIALYDTTLRDGTQRAGISLSLDDKLQIAEVLDQFGIDYIEGGWPASNPKDTAFFRLIQNRLTHSKVTAFGSTARKNVAVENDANLAALLEAQVPVVTIFGKSSAFQAHEILGVSLLENLRLVEDSVKFLSSHGVEVFFDAEHFFDGVRDDREYALDVVRAAVQGGAVNVALCDTNGGSLPSWVREMTSEVVRNIPVNVGIHAHNDGGLAVANSLEAVQAGAVLVQGTINGYGERCGNTDLCTLWPNLVLKMGMQAGHPDGVSRITHLSRFVSEIANLVPDAGAPFVGENAFTHKAGVHVGAVRKHPEAYEHVLPQSVGQERKVLVSELAGRSNLLYHFSELKERDPIVTQQVVDQVKQLESQGYQFEEAEASMTLLVQRSLGTVPEYYRVDRFHVSVAKGRDVMTEATVRIQVGVENIIEVAEGDGPVNALDHALRKCLSGSYPVLRDLRLSDYKVRVLDGREATRAMVRVLIRSEFRGQVIHTVGVSRNILEASWKALVDAVNYTLWKAEVVSIR